MGLIKTCKKIHNIQPSHTIPYFSTIEIKSWRINVTETNKDQVRTNNCFPFQHET